MAMAKYGHKAGSASAILGFAGMFSAGFVSPLVGIGGSHTGIPIGDCYGCMCCISISMLLYND